MSEIPKAIESNVPGEQQLRAGSTNETNSSNHNATITEDVYSPVIKITKEETSLTKGELKLQKVIVSEDISDDSTTVNKTVSVTAATGPNSVQTELRTEVTISSSSGGLVEDKNTQGPKTEEDDQNTKKITKIPKFKLRQAFEKLKKQEQIAQEKMKHEPYLGPKIKSAIPRLKDAKQFENIEKEYLTQEANKESPQLDDEFDKIYEEVVEKDVFNNNLPTPEKLQDLEKVDSKFEEIIHSYDDKTVKKETLTEKVKTKIPMLKRKSEHEIEIPPQLRKNSLKKSLSVDDKGRIPVAKMKAMNIEKEKTKVAYETSSASHSEVKSVNSTEAFESLNSTVSKTIKSQTIIESEQINISSKEENKIHIKNSEINFKEISKCKIPLPLHTKEKLETKVSNVQDTEHILNGSVNVSVNNKSTEKTLEEFKLVQKNQTQAQSESLAQKMDTKIHTTFNESQSYGQSTFTSEKTIINTSSDITEVSETSKIDNETRNEIFSTGQSKETVVDTLFHETSIDSKTIKDDKTICMDSDKETGENKMIVKNKKQKLAYSTSLEDTKVNATINNNIIESQKEKVKIKTQRENKNIINDKIVKKEIQIEPIVKSSQITDTMQENKINDSEITLTLNTTKSEVLAVINKQENKQIITTAAENIKEINETLEKPVRKSDISLQNIDLEEEEIIILKGKVNRIISRLDSREEKFSRTEVDDIPVDVSVTSKIAIFEKSEPINSEIEVRDDKPKIVEEILKTPVNNLRIKNYQIKNGTDNKKHNIETKKLTNTSETSLEENSNKNENFQGNYYTTYNKVHSSVLNRLNSIEMRFKTTEVKNEIKTESTSVDTSLQVTKTDKMKDNYELKTYTELKVKTEKLNNDFELKIFPEETNEVFTSDRYKEYRPKNLDQDRRAKSLAELDLGDAVKGRVRQMVFRMNSMEKMRLMRRDTVERKERFRQGSVTNRVALFEKKVVPIRAEDSTRTLNKPADPIPELTEEQVQEKIAELSIAKIKYGKWENMTYLELKDGSTIPVLAVGTALLKPQLIKHIIAAAIDLGYRAIDTAYIYGNEKLVGEAIKIKIEDGTVNREDLYIISKLWSTFHRRDLVEKTCKQSLERMGLEYFDMYMIHNPMSFKEGDHPIPKIANVLQYSEHDYLEAWYGIEDLIRKGLVKRGGVSNFNSVQVERVVEKGKIKPLLNQVECHPYLTQQRLDDFCSSRNIKLSCFGVLGSKGTPIELKSGLPPVIDDPLVKVMSAGLGVTPAQLLIAYQLQTGRAVVVKSSSAGHLWDNLQALNITLDQSQLSALNALNRNKRTFTFDGMGDTHRNYPFKIAF